MINIKNALPALYQARFSHQISAHGRKVQHLIAGHSQSQSVSPPLNIGVPLLSSLDGPMVTRSKLPIRDLVDARSPGNNSKSTFMNRAIMSLVTSGKSNPTICDDSNTYRCDLSCLSATTHPDTTHLGIREIPRHDPLSNLRLVENPLLPRSILPRPIQPCTIPSSFQIPN